MCGIGFYWAKEADIPVAAYEVLIKQAELRGQNGFGITVHRNGWTSTIRHTTPYTEYEDRVRDWLAKHTGDKHTMTFFSCRATPETEPMTRLSMLQPISHREKILIHNGGVTDALVKVLKDETDYEWATEIDSEAILAAYEEYGMKGAMEYLSGSFAFVMLEKEKDVLYVVTSFNPLYEMYIKGYGYFVHSDERALRKALYIVRKELEHVATKEGIHLVEKVFNDWYIRELDGYTIHKIFVKEDGRCDTLKYTPRFLHPTFYPENRSYKTHALVSASGGIDSGLTAQVLSMSGIETEMVHFSYGQKGQLAELWGAEMISEHLGLELHHINLVKLFEEHIRDAGMLSNPGIPVTTGGDFIKSTVAWVAGRNAIFASILMAMAEASILANEASWVWLASGWAQLSEETGGYPDNSFKFNQSIDRLRRYGYIAGHSMQFIPVMSQLTKTEEWQLGYLLQFPFQFSVSCDQPIFHYRARQVSLCQDCGSTKLSITAAERAGVPDPRIFHKVGPDGQYELFPYRDKEELTYDGKNLDYLVNRLVLPDYNKMILKEAVKKLWL